MSLSNPSDPGSPLQEAPDEAGGRGPGGCAVGAHGGKEGEEDGAPGLGR